MSSINDEIKSIFIKNIKGFNEIGKTINFTKNGQGLLPNKLNIIVAPNGFGKSSIAVAFKSISYGRKLHLDKKEFFKEDDTLDAEIKITCKLNNAEKELKANASTNEICKIFDVFTINSHLDTKGKRTPFRGADSDLIIKDIELMQIPETVKDLKYSIADIKTVLREKNFKILDKKDINDYIINLIKKNEISSFIQLLEKYSKKRAYKKLLTNPAECNDIDQKNISYLLAILEIYKLNKNQFKKFVAYQEYKLKQKFAKEILDNIRTFDNFDLKLKKKENKLVVKFPKANVISNGQRDVIVFLANLLRLEFNFFISNKNYGILIIDEVFDYLDDANLLIAQYFLVDLIKKIKKNGKKLFTLFLTHLAPNNFNHFYFNRKNFKKVYYLTGIPNINEEVVSFIKKREEMKKSYPKIYNTMSKFLHFGIENIDLPNIDGLSVSFNDKNNFIEMIKEEYKKYYNEKDYCPFSVAIFLRIFIEKSVYLKLSNNDLKKEYLQKNKTIDKLDFAKDNGVEIDERYYLLSAIYNEMAHNDKEILYFKLNNKIIRNLVIKVIQIPI
jgi:predicted Zn-ribbon and HTH transcriptional regulator